MKRGPKRLQHSHSNLVGGLGWIWVEKKEEEEIHKARGKMKEREEKQRK